MTELIKAGEGTISDVKRERRKAQRLALQGQGRVAEHANGSSGGCGIIQLTSQTTVAWHSQWVYGDGGGFLLGWR